MYEGNEQMIERYLSRSKFILKEECTFDYLYSKKNEELQVLKNKRET